MKELLELYQELEEEASIDEAEEVRKGRLRKLTTGEVTLLREVYGNNIDYSRICIRKGSYVMPKDTAFVVNERIFFHKDDYQDDFSPVIMDMAWLAHEVGHVWQYQKLNYKWTKAVLEHIKYGRGVYHYIPDPDKKLTDYRFEQQGAILHDYYTLRGTGWEMEKILEKIIYAVFERPEGLPPNKETLALELQAYLEQKQARMSDQMIEKYKLWISEAEKGAVS